MKQFKKFARSSIIAAVAAAAAACCWRLNSSRSTRVKADGVAERAASKGRKMLFVCKCVCLEAELAPTDSLALRPAVSLPPKLSLNMFEIEKASAGLADC